MTQKTIIVIARESVVEAREIMKYEEDASVLLVGRGLMLPSNLFGKRKVYAIAEEVEGMGIKGHLTEGIEVLSAKEIVDILAESKIWNYS